MHIRLLVLTLIFSLLRLAEGFSQGQGTQTDFGKNRIQYKDFDWFYYRSPHFDTYYYRGGKELGITVGKLAEQNLKDIEDMLDYRLDGKIQILAYNKLSDVRQTNLGLVTDNYSNTGGLTQIVGNKLFIYFDGDHHKLRRQIRAGLAQVLINDMLYGGNIQEMLQNSTLLTLPEWFIPGLVSYISEDWNVELDNGLKDGILTGRYKKFNRLFDNDARIAGHSIWKYIVDNYGSASISNILYMTRINRNPESGFLYVVGLTFKDLSIQWLDYYRDQYKNVDQDKTMPSPAGLIVHKNKKKPKSLPYNQLRLSPDGRNYAYLINDKGRFKVYLYDPIEKATRMVYKAGLKTTASGENSEPVLAWHPSSQLLAVSYEKKSAAVIEVININNKKENQEVLMYKYEKILDFDYSNDGRKWVLSAIRNGQSDIYVFDIVSRRDEQVTNDWYDDLNPHFMNRSSMIVFSSNRADDTLRVTPYTELSPFNNFDLVAYDYALKDPVLKRVTNTPFINEMHPLEYDTNKVAYLSDENGIVNRYMAIFDSVVDYSYDTTIYWYDTTITVYKDTFYTYPLTNYRRNILMHDINPRNKKFSELLYHDGRIQMYVGDMKEAASLGITPNPTSYRSRTLARLQSAYDKMQEQLARDSLAADSLGAKVDSSLIDVSNYYFQSDFPSKKTSASGQPQQQAAAPVEAENEKDNLDLYFRSLSPRPYLPVFSTNYVVSQLDNSMLSNSYQRFTGTGPIYSNSRINALIKIGTSDLMEDYRFTGGLRLAADLTIPEYFISFENLKKRLDKQFVFYKQGQLAADGSNRLNSYEVKSILKWPFSEISGLRLNTFYRRDETIFLSTDFSNIETPDQYDNHVGYKLEYVFDNTINKGLNLYNGTRYKVYLEQFIQVKEKDKRLTNIGFDARHYEKLSRQIILAARLAGATSIDKQKVIYYLGGVDNWILPRFNDNVQIDHTKNYTYQALATNMRGFNQNIRNGNNYLVLNTEVRIPVFAYFLNRPIKSDFVKNFQVVPFADLGSAWVGPDPFSENNRYNKIDYQNGPIKVTIIEPKYPIVGGFGTGLRSRLLGYFVRFDLSYGMENGVLQRRVYYFSLSLDF